jgi:MFS family permease
MKKHELLVWTSANALGLGVGFVATLQMKMLIDFGFDWEMHWHWIEKPVDQGVLSYVSMLIGLLVGGAIFGWVQALAVRSRNVRIIRWILATVTGFGVLGVAIEWPLIAFGVLGVIPGPVEPIIFAVGGGSLAGIFQYISMRREGIFAGKWLALWIMGLIVSLVPTGLFFFLVYERLDIALSWPVEIFFSGFIVAGVGALVSGKALFSVLPERPEISGHP